MNGKLIYKYGSMGSSKTTSLLIFAHELEEKNINFLCLKPAIDDRDGVGTIKSRIPGLERDCLTVYENSDIFDAAHDVIIGMEIAHPIKYLLIDESQFLSVAQVEQLTKIADLFKIIVICFGLKTDFQTNLFPGSKRLLELADTIDEFESVCKCGGNAIINARVDGFNNIIKAGEQIEIGYRYVALCRKCYYR